MFQVSQGGRPVLGERGRADGLVDEADVAEPLRIGRFHLDQGSGGRVPHLGLGYLEDSNAIS